MRRPDLTFEFKDEHRLDYEVQIWHEAGGRVGVNLVFDIESQWGDTLTQAELVEIREGLNLALDFDRPASPYVVRCEDEEGPYTITLSRVSENPLARFVSVEIERPGDHLWGGHLRRRHALFLRELLNELIFEDIPRERPRPPVTETQLPLPLTAAAG